MKGLELAEQFFNEYGLKMLDEFPGLIDRISVGLVGHGSECFGFDDDISTDHDFSPGFMIFISKEDYEKYGFKLERAYNSLPSEYKGIKIKQSSIYGNTFKGVHIVNDFYRFYMPDGVLPESLECWLSIPDYYLSEASNGKLFINNNKEFNDIREGLANRPNDIRLKKLASSLFYMAQYGQYNYLRCKKHDEISSSIYALSMFAKYTAEAIYLINNKYAPYYKWLFKGLDNLPLLSDIKKDIETLLVNPTDYTNNINIIENIAKKIIKELNLQNLSLSDEIYLEAQAYAVNNKIKDFNLREESIML